MTLQTTYIKAVNPSSGGGGSTLPSGTYIPVLIPSDPFHLVWETYPSATAGTSSVTKGSGVVQFEPTGRFLIPHEGDFTLQFNIEQFDTSILAMVGVTYYYCEPISYSNYYYNMANSWYRQDSYGHIFEFNQGPYTYVGVSDTTLFEIRREGNSLIYALDGVDYRTVHVFNTGPVYIDTTIATQFTAITNIQVIIP